MRWTITFTGDETGNVSCVAESDTAGVLVATVLNGVLRCAANLVGQVHAGETVPGPAVPVELPDGWEATADGVNVQPTMETGGQAHSRTYQCGETTLVAPCRQDGEPTAATVAALSAAQPEIAAEA